MKSIYVGSINYLKKNKQSVLCVLCGCILTYMYCFNIQYINTVWELADEAGYLCNAAYFAGFDWSDVASRLVYYGYGYSLFLIPLFFICKSGLNLIHGAIFLNCMFVLLSYCLQNAIMRKIFDKCNKLYIPIFAFILSIQPYIVSNTFKVLCEVCLTMWIWLIGYILISAMERKSYIKFLVLGIASCFIFFIHTRSIVVMGTVGLIMVLFLLIKRITFKEFCFFVFPLVIGIVALYCVKNSIIYDSLQIVSGDERSTVNLINGNYILIKLKGLFADFSNYIISFISRILYLIYATCGLILFGFIGCIKGIKEAMANHDDKSLIFYLYSGSIVLLMVLACTVNSVGTASPAYLFYSRYYEYVVYPLVMLGLYQIMSTKEEPKLYLWYIVITAMAGTVTWNAVEILESTKITVDTARFPGLTTAILKSSDFRTLVTYIAGISIVWVLVFAFLSKREKLRVLIPIIVCVVLIRNSNSCLEEILKVNDGAYEDVLVADFMTKNVDDKEIIFVDSNYKWIYYYSRMQVLAKDKKLVIFEEEMADDIEEGKYFVTYLTSNLGKRLLNEGKLVEAGSVFGVFSN